MGLLSAVRGYSDKEAKSIAHYLRIIAAPRANNSNLSFYKKCAPTPTDAARFLLCAHLYNLSATLAIIDSRYSYKSEEMQIRVFNAFCGYIDRSPSNLLITDYILDQQELQNILQTERIDESHRTNEYSIFNMVWRTRGLEYRYYLREFPEIRKKSIRNPEENDPNYKPINVVPWDFPEGYNFKDEMLNLFIRHYAGLSSNDFSKTPLVNQFLYGNLKALVEYLWPGNYDFDHK